jgi:hypothetical protein
MAHSAIRATTHYSTTQIEDRNLCGLANVPGAQNTDYLKQSAHALISAPPAASSSAHHSHMKSAHIKIQGRTRRRGETAHCDVRVASLNASAPRPLCPGQNGRTSSEVGVLRRLSAQPSRSVGNCEFLDMRDAVESGLVVIEPTGPTDAVDYPASAP